VRYKCEICGWEGESAWRDADARAEAERNGFCEADGPLAIICEDCYHDILGEALQ
jgi:hypothetical protein